MAPSLYDVIGMTPEASDREIYKAVKKTARSVKDSDATKSEKKNLMKFIKKARDTLLDPELREKYDRTIGIETIRSNLDNVDVMSSHSFNPVEDLLGSLGGSMVPFGSTGSVGSIGSVGSTGNLMSSHMDMIQSIIPEGFGDLHESTRNMKSGTFHFTEYTRVRNPSGGFDEFGMTREGDTNSDRVTEKRYHKKG